MFGKAVRKDVLELKTRSMERRSCAVCASSLHTLRQSYEKKTSTRSAAIHCLIVIRPLKEKVFEFNANLDSGREQQPMLQ